MRRCGHWLAQREASVWWAGRPPIWRRRVRGTGASLVDMLARTTLAASKREARDLLGTGAISVNGVKVEADRMLESQDLLEGRIILLRRGRKHWHAAEWE